MTGTLVNFAGIIAGSLIGLLLKRGLPEQLSAALLKVQGLAIVVIGFNGVISAMFHIDPVTGKLSSDGALLLLVSLVGGCIVGELLRIDDRFNSFGLMVEQRSGASNFAKGFVTASLIFVIGAMSIIGPINDGLTGDSSILYVKTILDAIISIMLAASLGVGVIFSAIPVLLWQGTVALLAGYIAPFISDALLDVFCMVGYALVMAIGFNFLCETKLKVANLLPALAFPVAYYFMFVA